MFRTRRAAGTSLTPSTSRRAWPSCTATSRPPSRPTPRSPGWGSGSTEGCWAWGRQASSPRTCSWVRTKIILASWQNKEITEFLHYVNWGFKPLNFDNKTKKILPSYFLLFHVSFFVPTKRCSTLFMNPFMHILKVKILKLHTVLQCPSFRMPWMIWDDSCTTVSECHRVLIPYLDTRGSDHRPRAHYVTMSPSSSCHQLSQPRCQPLYCPPLTFLTINNICFASTH